MNKKGFTLIELLAIIVILAIIAVVTVPIVLGIIDEAKEKAARNSVIGYGKAVEFSYSKAGAMEGVELESCEATDGSCITIGERHLKVDFSGDKVVCTSASVDSVGKLTMTGCKVGTDTTNWTYNNGDVSKSNSSSASSNS